MISPATSGEIFTSVSGCTFPVAETVCTMVLRMAFSVVTGIGFSRLFQIMDATMKSTISPIEPQMICFLRRARRCFAVSGAGGGVLTCWCIVGAVRGVNAFGIVGYWSLSYVNTFMTTLHCDK